MLSDEIKAVAGGFEKGGTIPLYLGRRFRPKGDDAKIFNSGGAGYVMNRAAVALLAPRLDLEECEAHRKCFWEDVQASIRRLLFLAFLFLAFLSSASSVSLAGNCSSALVCFAFCSVLVSSPGPGPGPGTGPGPGPGSGSLFVFFFSGL